MSNKQDSQENRSVRGSGGFILVVEDDQTLRRLIMQLMGILGYRAESARNGDAALHLVEEQGLRPVLVLTDVVMPGMGGRMLVERLRKTLPGIKVIFMSGYTNDAVIRQGVLDAGIEFLQKPFDPSVLAAKIQSALS